MSSKIPKTFQQFRIKYVNNFIKLTTNYSICIWSIVSVIIIIIKDNKITHLTCNVEKLKTKETQNYYSRLILIKKQTQETEQKQNSKLSNFITLNYSLNHCIIINTWGLKIKKKCKSELFYFLYFIVV